MRRVIRILTAIVLVALMLPLASTAVSANKRIYKAQLRTTNEVGHDVVGSSATGSALFGFNMDGTMQFLVNIRGLSGSVNGMHLHGPATTSENAPVIITLCGNPTPGVLATCDVVDGTLSISGTITSTLLASWGLSPATLVDWLDSGMVYINVHTPLNPAGEVRGQLIPQ